MRERVYLDHNATAPLRSKVRTAMIEAMTVYGNPSSVHEEGRKARAIVERGRERIGALLGARSDEVLFTSSGTEANMTALSPHLLADTAEARAEALLFVSAIEHPSVLAGGRFPSDRVRLIPVDADGVLDIDAFIEMLEQHGIEPSSSLTEPSGDNPPFMVSVMLANNETGALQPVTEIAGIVLERGGFMHCDAVQALGRIPFDLNSLGVDLVSIAAHKIGGPKGVGALVGPGLERVVKHPLLRGGGQQSRRRAGTENVVGIAGFAEAAEMACDELADREMSRFLRDRLETRMKRRFDRLRVFCAGTDRLGNTSMMALPGLSAEIVLMRMDLEGVALSSGSACSSGKVSPSHVLEAMGVPDDLASCAFRISFGPENWMSDLDRVIEGFEKLEADKNKTRSSIDELDVVRAVTT